MKTKQNYQKLFNPRSIAIVGASEKEGKVGTVIAKNIMTLGFEGDIFFINPQYDVLYDKKCYSDISSVGKLIDLAIISVPAEYVMDVIKKSFGSVKNFVIISAGFAEIGKDGQRREAELKNLAKEHELNILGPNCLGFIIPSLKLNASFAGGMPTAGNVSFVSQSGALAVALMDVAGKRNVAFSSVISVGNKMQIDETALLEYFGQDKKTKVIALYLEGIKNGTKFIETAQRVCKVKPVVILKAGKSRKAQEAISSHTGALAGSDLIMNKAFEKAGIMQAENLEDFFDLISFMSSNDSPKNSKVAVVTNAGGAGVLSADAFEGKSIGLIDFSSAQQKELKSFLPQESSVSNPIDLLGDAQEDRYESILKILEKNKEISSILCILTPQQQTPVMKIAEKIVAASKKSKKIITTSFVGGERVEGAIEYLKQNDVQNFSFPERAVSALDTYFSWKNRMSEIKISKEKIKINSKRQASVMKIIDHARLEGRRALYYDEACEIMKMYGIVTAPSRAFLPRQKFSGEFSFPVVAKIDSDQVLHKSDRQALVVNIKNDLELDQSINALRKNFPNERIIVQNQQEKGMEIILGIKRDSIFDTVIVYGMGGIYTEIFKKVGFILPPIDKKEIENELLRGSLGFLLKETRGQRPYDLKGLAAIVSGLIEFSSEISLIRECDINPLFIYNDGKAACAVDIKIII